MTFKMEDYIGALQQSVPSSLLNTEYAESIRNVSRQLPLLYSGFFEFWFGEGQSRVDLNIAIDRKLNENKAIVAYLDRFSAHHTLASLEKPITEWSALDQQLWLFTRWLILVYDIPDPRQPWITPWYYVTFNPPPLFSGETLFQTEIVLTILKRLNESFSFTPRSEWESFFNNTLPATRIDAIGFQANRQVDALRVVLHFDNYTDICSFLEIHQWPGNFDSKRKQANDVAAGCDAYRLTIDVNPALQPKIGIECLYNTIERAEKGYKQLTDKLVAKGICTGAQQAAFLAWEGSFYLKEDPNEWACSDKDYSLPHPATTICIKKAPKHIKIVFEPGSPMTAKGYLGYYKAVR